MAGDRRNTDLLVWSVPHLRRLVQYVIIPTWSLRVSFRFDLSFGSRGDIETGVDSGKSIVTQHPWHREALMLMLVVPLFLFVPLGVGLWFDTRTSAAPWGLLIGMGTGAAAATFFLVHRLGSVYRAIAPDTEDDQEKK